MRAFLFYTLLIITLTGYAQKNQIEKGKTMNTQSTEESQVLEVARLLIKLMIDRDTSWMNEIVDKNFSLTHITDYVQPKDDWFAEIESESMKYYSAEEVYSKVDIDGTKATCVIRHLLDARIWGSRNTWHLQQTFQMENRDGEWFILNSMAKTF